MKTVFSLIVLSILTSNTYALSKNEVKSIINLAAIGENYSERVVNVESSKHVLTPFGQFYDLLDTSHDFEINKVQIVYRNDLDETSLANCDSLIRLNSKQFTASVDIRGCRDAITDADVRLNIESLENESIGFRDGELVINGKVRVIDATSVVAQRDQITDLDSAFGYLKNTFKRMITKPIKNGLFR